MSFAPIALFAYKRVDKLQLCVEALATNQYADKTDLIIFSDGYKGEQDKQQVEEVRLFLKEAPFKIYFQSVKVIERDKNLGLANSIIGGVTQVINEYGKIIVVEDDLITAPDFICYMNAGLNYYEKLPKYGSISAYTYPLKELKTYKKDVYVTRKGDCWGWGTWKDRWTGVDWEVKDFEEYFKDRELRRQFDQLEKGLDNMLVRQMNGQIDSWAVRWCYHLYKKGQLTVYPRESRTRNIGLDGSGTHCTETNRYNVTFQKQRECKFEDLEVDQFLEQKNAVFTSKKSIADVLSKIIRKILKETSK